MGIISEDHLDDAIKTIDSLLKKTKTSNEGTELKTKFEEFTLIKDQISEELATIIMKRIVPGKCKYCPF